MVHISPQRGREGKRLRQQMCSRPHCTHTHTQDTASSSRDTTFVLIRPAYVLFPEYRNTCVWAIKYETLLFMFTLII